MSPPFPAFSAEGVLSLVVVPTSVAFSEETVRTDVPFISSIRFVRTRLHRLGGSVDFSQLSTVIRDVDILTPTEACPFFTACLRRSSPFFI